MRIYRISFREYTDPFNRTSVSKKVGDKTEHLKLPKGEFLVPEFDLQKYEGFGGGYQHLNFVGELSDDYFLFPVEVVEDKETHNSPSPEERANEKVNETTNKINSELNEILFANNPGLNSGMTQPEIDKRLEEIFNLKGGISVKPTADAFERTVDFLKWAFGNELKISSINVDDINGGLNVHLLHKHFPSYSRTVTISLYNNGKNYVAYSELHSPSENIEYNIMLQFLNEPNLADSINKIKKSRKAKSIDQKWDDYSRGATFDSGAQENKAVSLTASEQNRLNSLTDAIVSYPIGAEKLLEDFNGEMRKALVGETHLSPGFQSVIDVLKVAFAKERNALKKDNTWNDDMVLNHIHHQLIFNQVNGSAAKIAGEALHGAIRSRKKTAS